MRGACAFALMGALFATTTRAAAQDSGVTARATVEGVYARQTGLPPPNDWSVQAAPQLTYLVIGKRSQTRVTYDFAANFHTDLPNDIANRVALASSIDLSQSTQLLLSAEAGHSTIRNTIVTAGAAQAPLGVLPSPSIQFLTTRVSEATSTDVSPAVRFDQTVDATYIRTLDTVATSAGMLANAVGTLEHAWKRQGLGIDFRTGYLNTRAEPAPREQLVTFGLTPHWRTDITPSVSALFVTGAWAAVSAYADSHSRIRPWAQGQLTYVFGSRSLAINAQISPLPNPLSAQLLDAGEATARFSTPLNARETIVASATLGYLHASLLQLRDSAPVTPSTDSLIGDVELSWQIVSRIELFARYQFLDQIAGGLLGADLVRNAGIVGLSFSSRADNVRVPTHFSPRVDRSNGQLTPELGKPTPTDKDKKPPPASMGGRISPAPDPTPASKEPRDDD